MYVSNKEHLHFHKDAVHDKTYSISLLKKLGGKKNKLRFAVISWELLLAKTQ